MKYTASTIRQLRFAARRKLNQRDYESFLESIIDLLIADGIPGEILTKIINFYNVSFS